MAVSHSTGWGEKSETIVSLSFKPYIPNPANLPENQKTYGKPLKMYLQTTKKMYLQTHWENH